MGGGTADRRGTANRGTANRGTENRGTENRGTENRGTENRGTKRRVQAVTALVDEGMVVFTLDDGTTRAVRLSYNGRPAAGRHVLTRPASAAADASGRGFVVTPRIAGTANADGRVLAWTAPVEATFVGVTRYTLTVVSGRTAPGKAGNLRAAPAKIELAAADEDGGDQGDAHGEPEALGDDARGTRDRGTEARGTDDRGTDDRGTGDRGTGDDAAADAADPSAVGFEGDLAMLADGTDVRLAPADEDAWRAIAKLAVGRGETPPDPVELIRQYRLWMRHVDRQVFADDGGEQWTRVMTFLEANQKRLEGKLHATRTPGFTVAALEKLLEEHDRIAPPEAVEERDPDDPLRYDPGVALLSPGERKLLAELARTHPDMVTEGTIKQPYISVLAKVVIALRLTYRLWPKEVAVHAAQAFSDPVFVATTVTILGVYWALWLVPDPSAVTKAAAAALTAVMLYYFSKDVVLAFLLAVRRLFEDCDRTLRVEELEAAGRRFAKAVGKLGFEILLFLVTWRIGKRLEPKLRAYAASRQLARAEARLAELRAYIESLGGADGPTIPDVLAKARAAAGDRATPAEVLAKLRELLPDDARQGLEIFAASKTKTPRKSSEILTSLTHAARGKHGGDVVAFLRWKRDVTQKGLIGPALRKAEAEVVRARLEHRRVYDQRVATALRRERIRRFLDTMEKRGVLPKIAAALKQRMKIGKQDPDTVMAIIAEAITLTELRLAYPATRGYRVLGNVEIVREVEGFSTIAEWQRAHPGKKAKNLREAEGKVWESITEVDGMAVEVDAAGKWRPREMEQTKSGEQTVHEAVRQNEKALAALAELAAGTSQVNVFLSAGQKAKLGENITTKLALDDVASLKCSTRGPTGGEPAFDKDLYGMSRDTMRLVAEVLMAHPPASDAALKSLPAPNDRRTDEP